MLLEGKFGLSVGRERFVGSEVDLTQVGVMIFLILSFLCVIIG